MTGGGDGSIRLNHVEGPRCCQLPLPNEKEIPRLVAILKCGFIALSQLGSLYGCSDESNFQNWTPLFQDVRLSSGTVMHADDDTLIFGSPTGAVLIFSLMPGPNVKLISQLELEESKIYSIQLIGSDQFLACLDQGRMILRNLCGADEEVATYSFVLPSGKQRWPACAIKSNDIIIVGDRDGSLHFYRLNENVSFSKCNLLFLFEMIELIFFKFSSFFSVEAFAVISVHSWKEWNN